MHPLYYMYTQFYVTPACHYALRPATNPFVCFQAEAVGPRRPMARSDTVEKKAPAPAVAAAAVPEKRPAPAAADNGRVTEEPRRRPTLTHQKSSSAGQQRPQEPAPASTSRAPQAPPPPPAPPAPPAPPPAPPAPPPPAFLAGRWVNGANGASGNWCALRS